MFDTNLYADRQITRNTFLLQAFANPEDVSPLSRKLKPKFDDPDVERVRRFVQNRVILSARIQQ